MAKVVNERLHKMTFEELLDEYGEWRFGSSMLPNRTLNSFNNFVMNGIFMEKTDEYAFFAAYNWYSVQEGISEFERLRRWFIIFMLFEMEKYPTHEDKK